MDWFYARNGQQVGPVPETELAQLVQSGAIQPETLVWHAGMAEWQPYRSAGPGVAAEGIGAEAGPVRFCTSCGKAYPSSDLALFGESAVCAACKPAYVH